MSLATDSVVQPDRLDDDRPMGLCPLCDRYILLEAAIDPRTGLPMADSMGRPVLIIPEHVVPEPPPAAREPRSPLVGVPWYYPIDDETTTGGGAPAGLLAAGPIPVAH